MATAAAILVASGGLGGLKDKVHDLEDLITASGYLGPLIYAGAYTTATVLLFPASVLTLAAGYLFGEERHVHIHSCECGCSRAC